MLGWLVGPYLVLVGFAVAGSLSAWRLWQRHGLPFLRPFALYVALCFAHALLTFVGEVFGPAIVGAARPARAQAYLLVDLVTIPLLAGIFLALLMWVKDLLGRTPSRTMTWSFVAFEAGYLALFAGVLIAISQGGNAVVASLALLALDAGVVFVAALAVWLLLSGATGSAEPYRLPLARGLGRVYAVSFLVLGFFLLGPTMPFAKRPGPGAAFLPMLVFLLNVPALTYLWTRLERLPLPPVGASADDEALARLVRSAGISEREAEVIRLVAAGLDNRGIGEKLFISPKTVKNHITSVYAKTRVRNRVQLANLVRPKSLLPSSHANLPRGR